MGTSPRSEERVWIEKACQGDLAAFGNLVKAYQRPVFNLTYRMLGNAPDAEDAAQETFVRAFRKLDTFDPRRKFSSWILAIASNYCVDQLRKRRHQRISLEELPPWRQPPGSERTPGEVVAQSEAREEVQALLEALPPEDRAVVVMRYWYDMSYQEIAQTTERTVSSVKSRLHRARRRLAETWEARRGSGDAAGGQRQEVPAR